jgi:hypothetical protein
LSKAIESCFDFAWFARLQNWSRHSECACCRFHICPEASGRAEIRIDENNDGAGRRTKPLPENILCDANNKSLTLIALNRIGANVEP